MDEYPALKAVIDAYFASPTNPNSNYFSLKGPAGSGKTTVIRAMTEYFGENTIVCAPTNKACRVLHDKDIIAHTLHAVFFAAKKTSRTKLVKYPLCNADGTIRLDDHQKIMYASRDEPIFTYDFNLNQVSAKTGISPQDMILIIDESSMVGAKMWHDLITNNVRIIAVGDADQLPPIESDITEIERKLKAHNTGTARLHLDDVSTLSMQLRNYRKFENHFHRTPANYVMPTIFRQAAGNMILTVADQIRQMGTYPRPYTSREYSAQTNNDLVAIAPILAGADICLAHKNATCEQVNSIIRGRKFPENPDLPTNGDVLYVDARHLIEINGIDETILTKGEIITIDSPPIYDMPNGIMVCDVRNQDGDRKENVVISLGFVGHKKTPNIRAALCSYGYCLTVHKSQGSQWDHIVLLDEGLPFHRKEWLYTAVTRAAKTLSIYRV